MVCMVSIGSRRLEPLSEDRIKKKVPYFNYFPKFKREDVDVQ